MYIRSTIMYTYRMIIGVNKPRENCYDAESLSTF